MQRVNGWGPYIITNQTMLSSASWMLYERLPGGELCVLRSLCSWGYTGLCPPRAESCILWALSPCVLFSATGPNPYLLESQTHLTQWQPCLEDVQSFVCFIHIFAFSRRLVALPSAHTGLFFTRPHKGQRHCARWGIKVLQTPKSRQSCVPLSHSWGLGKLVPYGSQPVGQCESYLTRQLPKPYGGA